MTTPKVQRVPTSKAPRDSALRDGHVLIGFGRYEHWTWPQVAQFDPQYVRWAWARLAGSLNSASYRSLRAVVLDVLKHEIDLERFSDIA